jgi:hypothetical protein
MRQEWNRQELAVANKIDTLLNKPTGIICCFGVLIYDWHANIALPYIPGILIIIVMWCIDRIDRRAKSRSIE